MKKNHIYTDIFGGATLDLAHSLAPTTPIIIADTLGPIAELDCKASYLGRTLLGDHELQFNGTKIYIADKDRSWIVYTGYAVAGAAAGLIGGLLLSSAFWSVAKRR